MPGGSSTYGGLPSDLLDLQNLYKWWYEDNDTDILYSDDTELIENDTDYTEYKTKEIPQEIKFSKFTIKVSSKTNATTGYIKFLRDGVQIGAIESFGPSAYVTYTRDVEEVNSGEVFSIEGKTSGDGDLWIKNFRIYGEIIGQLIDIDLPTWS